jgi:RNA polymerase sigma factor (sigma-70 family)
VVLAQDHWASTFSTFTQPSSRVDPWSGDGLTSRRTSIPSLEPNSNFTTTHWSVVRAAGRRDSEQATLALEQLCRTYWYPIYAYARRSGLTAADAEDLTQEFFARLLAGDSLSRADPAKGRFRSYLLAGLKHLLSDERKKAGRLKRGGGRSVVPVDEVEAEDRYRLELTDPLTPERAFERGWATMVLAQAAALLRAEYGAAGKDRLYEQLSEFRLDGGEPRSYAEVAIKAGLSESAIKSAVHRLRRRHYQLVREEIARTVADPADVDEEIRYLLNVMSG